MSSVRAIAEVLKRYEGAPEYWAEVFAGFGWDAADAEAWLESAQRDAGSPLRGLQDAQLNASLLPYAGARGIKLNGVGDGDDVVAEKPDRLVHCVSTVTTPAEQAVIMEEVSAYADVRFKEKLNGVYTAHAVANAVRAVHAAYVRRMHTPETSILEVGASVKAAVLAGVIPEKNHLCCPVLDVRDSVRHSIRNWLQMVADPDRGFKRTSQLAAVAALDETSGFVCRRKADECTRQVDCIVSNESTHDISFHDLPKIMARHGARLWTGFMVRAYGVRRTGGPDTGSCSVLGTRWRVDRSKDQISFHFDKGANFSYEHKFSEWVCYEEKFGYRWRGTYFDYVYQRLPITTKSTIAFAVVRVPKTANLTPEPMYAPSGGAGMMEVTSIRAVGGCVGKPSPVFEPCTFCVEQLVFDRAMEARLAQGERGNLASTMAYLRSARVKLGFNGVALGTVSSIPVDLLEATGVAIEVIVADKRRAGQRDYAAIMKASSQPDVLSGLVTYFRGAYAKMAAASDGIATALRQALLRVLDGDDLIVVRAVPCPAYVRVDQGEEMGVVAEQPALDERGCGCSELVAVRAALAMGSALGKQERKELSAYASRLQGLSRECKAHNPLFVSEEEACEMYFDANESVDTGESVREVRSVATSDLAGDGKLTDDSGFVSESSCADGAEFASDVVDAMKEYARWAQKADACARSEAALWYDVLFQFGNPTEDDVARSSTPRTRHAVVAVRDGKIEKIVGTLLPTDGFSEIYSGSLRRTLKVKTNANGQKYVSEAITELCYTGTDLKVVNGDDLCRATLRVVGETPKGMVLPRYTYVCGVPGSGKTYEIIQSLKKDLEKNMNVIYLTATTASRDHVIRAMAKTGGVEDRFSAMTYDAFVMHGCMPKDKRSFEMAYFDEVALQHKGEIFTAMVKLGLPSVKLYGDPHQIPWLPFMDEFEAKHAVLGAEFNVEHRNMTHRFGRKTCAMWLDVYEQLYPCECHDHDGEELNVVQIRSTSEVPPLNGGKILVFTQEEKTTVHREMGFLEPAAALKARDEGGLSTVAEDQGGSHQDVGLVRVANRKNPKESKQSPSIYNKQPWVLVATTRHVRGLTYYTVATRDLVVARMALSECSFRLHAVDNRQCWNTISMVAAVVEEFGV